MRFMLLMMLILVADFVVLDGAVLADRDPRWHRRNALIVVGNAGGDARPVVAARVATVLSRYLAGDDPLLRGHAVWAARRLGRDDLLPATDSDPDVQAELSAPLG